MKHVRVIQAPRQEDSRIVVLGLVLWPDHVSLHAVVESDQGEIEELHGEAGQYGMFSLTDDIGTDYEVRNGGCDIDPRLHVRDWTITLDPAVPVGACTVTVTHVCGRVDIPL